MLLVIEMLIGGRADVAQRRVTPSSIIERFDVEEKVSPGFVARAVYSATRPLALQRAEEAFHRGIVAPTANTVHTGLDVVLFEQLLVGVVGVLTTLIRVVKWDPDLAGVDGGPSSAPPRSVLRSSDPTSPSRQSGVCTSPECWPDRASLPAWQCR
jgi:hypothetical protein